MTTWILITTIMTIANVILAFTKTAKKIVEAINKICLIFAKREQSKYEKDKAIIQKAMNDCGFQPLNLVHGGPGCYSLISKIEKIRNYLLGNASFESLHTHLKSFCKKKKSVKKIEKIEQSFINYISRYRNNHQRI